MLADLYWTGNGTSVPSQADQNSLHQDSAAAAAATEDEIFRNPVEPVKFANLQQINETTAQWTWLCKSYKN
jgi:hypothetical protein